MERVFTDGVRYGMCSVRLFAESEQYKTRERPRRQIGRCAAAGIG